MLVLKISYWVTYAAAGILLLAAMVEEDVLFLAFAIGAFIAGSLIAGLDKIVVLLSLGVETPMIESETETANDGNDHAGTDDVVGSPKVTSADIAELERRIAASKGNL